MAVLPYFVLSPNTILSIYGLMRGPDKTVPTPAEDWREATVDVVIPALNEEKNIVFALASIINQTLKPKRIIIVDDGSSDRTMEYAKSFCEQNNMPAVFIKREKPIGKTPTIKRQAREFDSDVEFILDGDTVLLSENYIERTVQELYQGIGIASSCGTILPFDDNDRKKFLNLKSINNFKNKVPDYDLGNEESFFSRLNKKLTNFYRNIIYIFLQRFIYVGQMALCGSITNPVGCAVAYRRKYIKDLFDKYEPILGDDLTNSEDIFIGFALVHQGYRNIQLNDVYAKSQEPIATRLPRQMYLWSSSFLQSCYYFNDLVKTPFKYIKNLLTFEIYRKKKREKEFEEKRKIKEQYRQGFGENVTKKYGRPLGWVIFTSLVEKMFFPIVLLLMVVLQWWEALIVTIIAETIVYLVSLIYVGKKHSLMLSSNNSQTNNDLKITFGGRFKFFLQGILVTPIRYFNLIVDFFTILRFSFDIWITKDKSWRK